MRYVKQKSTTMMIGNNVFLVEGQSLGTILNVTGNIFEVKKATEYVVRNFNTTGNECNSNLMSCKNRFQLSKIFFFKLLKRSE